MKRKEILLFVIVLSFSKSVDAQNFHDYIVKLTGDTIHCRITWVNNQHVFYNYKNNKRFASTYVATSEIKTYQWITKDQLPPETKGKTLYAYDSTKSIKAGFGITHNFYSGAHHTSICANLFYKEHNFYFGVEHNWSRKNNFYFIDDKYTSYHIKKTGLNFGYRYHAKSAWKKSNLFLQLNFSMYYVHSRRYSPPPAHGVTHRNFFSFENSGDVGFNHRIFNRMELLAGLGINSPGFFFPLPYQPSLHLFGGLNYRLIK